MIYILGNRVSNPKNEKEINEGRKRIDIVFKNIDSHGFFYDLNFHHKIKCPKIIVECKNYGNDIGNPEIDQLMGRLSRRISMFGILVCRSISDKKLMLKRCKDLVNADKGYIIVLDDSDISQLIKFKEKGKEDKIDELLETKFDALIM